MQLAIIKKQQAFWKWSIAAQIYLNTYLGELSPTAFVLSLEDSFVS